MLKLAIGRIPSHAPDHVPIVSVNAGIFLPHANTSEINEVKVDLGTTLGAMATVLLVRHGRTGANEKGILAGTAPGTVLDNKGIEQAQNLAELLAGLEVSAIISSPLERTMQTAEALAATMVSKSGDSLEISREPELAECEYGDWTGRSLSELAQEDLWRAVQNHPASVTFPGAQGESMSNMAQRAVGAIRRWNDILGPDSVYVAVSHGDVIKAILADALGLHLDLFQRIGADPGSISVINYTPSRPFVLSINGNGSDIRRHVSVSHKIKDDAPVGGGSGD
jgi:probable phosphomutase (TIGR03848 family)